MLENQLLCANLCASDITNQSNPSFYAKPYETISLEAQTVYKGIMQIFDKHVSKLGAHLQRLAEHYFFYFIAASGAQIAQS